MDEEDSRQRKNGPIFEPPVYIQRYDFVESIVRQFGAKKVIDFGCSEGKLINQLKKVECVEELVGIDIDLDTLEFNKNRTRPYSCDYLDPRTRPLTVSLYQGSIAECDERFVNFDVIACVEMIEHLHPPVLQAMPITIFGHLKPNVVIITTPNSEFNVLFPDLKGFRHYDHKFEWTRAEFQSWCLQECKKYGYTVSFSGVGDGPVGRENLGHCSQIAVFIKKEDENGYNDDQRKGKWPYVKVISCVHPFKKERSLEELISDELEYYILFLADEYKKDEKSLLSEIPLQSFLQFPRISKLAGNVHVLRKAVQNSQKLELSESQTAIVYKRPHGEWSIDDEYEGTNWDSEGVGSNYNQYYKVGCPTEENWDVEMEDDDCEEDVWSTWRTNNASFDGLI
ncbi:small RNA 2'-O-methyltransferase-like [Xenia sp. Carnegie-2017]|uniref:small RNA 2'-O-methyltransferase-like n=1 Tax=Xenia sp. Carnegie-2017 TaxID=2897299 RepID=UPI001F03E0F7|nr:small RNA 2'-O-methyltransferase-like [Xenia sp. Carnegie-2017]